MDIQELNKVILTSTLVSGIVSAIFTWIFNVNIKSIEYKNTILKEFFSERTKAFKEIRDALEPFKGNVIIRSGEKKNFAFDLVFDFAKFNDALFNLQSIKGQRFWLSEKAQHELKLFTRLMVSIANEINKEKGNKENLARIGINYQPMVFVQLEIVLHQINTDFLSPFNLKEIKSIQKKKDPSIMLAESGYNFIEIKKQIEEKTNR